MTTVSATVAKNEFGRILESAVRGKPVAIQRRKETAAVLISKAEYDALSGAREASLTRARAQYDALFEQMQTPRAIRGARKALRMTPEELGRAAVTAARKRGA